MRGIPEAARRKLVVRSLGVNEVLISLNECVVKKRGKGRRGGGAVRLQSGHAKGRCDPPYASRICAKPHLMNTVNYILITQFYQEKVQEPLVFLFFHSVRCIHYCLYSYIYCILHTLVLLTSRPCVRAKLPVDVPYFLQCPFAPYSLQVDSPVQNA